MSLTTRQTILLGPQRAVPTLDRAVESLDIPADAKIAAITAGWEEREPEDLELAEHLSGRVVNLRIHQRADDFYQRDPELLEAMRRRHDWLRRLQDLYRLRLSHALEAARQLLQREDDTELLAPEIEAAIEAVRELDRHHLARVREIINEWEQHWRPAEREAGAQHRREIEDQLRDCGALCVAGGHVAILLNRTRLFDLLPLLGDRPVLGWSAGAMALSEKVVLFHDSPPQGPGDAEILGPGLGVCPGVVPLPHAKRRLRLDDRDRVSLFARRFKDDLCVALDERCQVRRSGPGWDATPETRQLTGEGTLVPVGGAS